MTIISKNKRKFQANESDAEVDALHEYSAQSLSEATFSTFMSAAFDALGGEDFLDNGLSGFTRGSIDAGSLRDWTCLSDFENAIIGGRHQYPRIRMFRAGSAVPMDDYVRPTASPWQDSDSLLIDDLAIASLLRDGASLIVDSIEEAIPGVRRAQEFLEYRVREPVQVNGFLTWGTECGVGAHWDDHDVIIVQMHGRKRWRVMGPGDGTRPMFKNRDSMFEEPDSIVAEVDLEQGDVIHIPRGWWHEVRGVGECSLHFTFAFSRPTLFDAVAQFVENLATTDICRSEVDLFHWSSLKGQGESLRRQMIASVEDLSLERLVLARTVGSSRRRGLSLPWAVEWINPGPRLVRCACRIPPLIAPSTGPELSVLAFGNWYRFDQSIEPLLRALCKGDTYYVDRLVTCLGLTEEILAMQLRELLEAGLIILE